MEAATKKRIEWIDALRALAMILVIYGHRVPEWSGYFVFTSPIKIPLFFAITGYVFTGVDKSVKDFFFRLIRTIVIPWIVLSVLPYLIAAPIKGVPYLLSNLKEVVIGDKYWYMPCCIVAEIIWFAALKVFKKPWQVALTSVVLFVAGIVLYHFDTLSVFMINRALTVQVYLLIGWLFKRYEIVIVERIGKMPILLIACAVYIGLGIVSLYVYPGQVMDVHLNKYYNYIICLMMIWFGILSLFIAAKKYLKRVPGWWTAVGQNTLVIYLFHSFIVRLGAKAFQLVHLPVNKLTNVLLTAIACAICLGIALLINWLFPELMGKKRKVRKREQ